MTTPTHACRIREAHPGDADLAAQWNVALAWETEHKRLDPATVRAGVAAGIADPQRARYFIAMDDAAVAGHETIATAASSMAMK